MLNNIASIGLTLRMTISFDMRPSWRQSPGDSISRPDPPHLVNVAQFKPNFLNNFNNLFQDGWKDARTNAWRIFGEHEGNY